MANISSSSSSFSLLIVLSVLLVAANNAPTSHGRPQNVQISVSMNVVANQIPAMISGYPVHLALIISPGSTDPLLFQKVTANPNAVTKNLLILSSGGVARTPTIMNQVPPTI
ncbi:hypothetical protein MKW92_004160, partial [Papaver armeniacum]